MIFCPSADSLFELIQRTHQSQPALTRVAYADNAAILTGNSINHWVIDPKNYHYTYQKQQLDWLIKVETHNHPTAISPFPGAATGSGGEIRDEAAAGQPLQIEDEVVPSLAKLVDPAQELARDPGAATALRDPPAGKGHDFIESRMGGDRRREPVLNNPLDPGARIGPAKAGQNRHGAADITEGARAN